MTKEMLIKKYKNCVVTNRSSELCDIFYIDSNINNKYKNDNCLLMSLEICKMFNEHKMSIDETGKVVISPDIMKNKSFSDYHKYNYHQLVLGKVIIKNMTNHYEKFKEINKIIIDDNKISTKGKPKKVVFEKERIEILNKIKKILDLNENNNKFLMYDLENDEKKVKQICDLKADIGEYFGGKDRAAFVAENSKVFLSLLKIVFKEMGIDCMRAQKRIKRGDKTICSSCYALNI